MRTRRGIARLCAIAACAALLLACSEDSTPEPHSTTGAGGAGGGASGTLTVHVLRLSQVTWAVPENTAVGVVDAEEVTVTLHAPDGTPRELETGSDGRVTFDAIDWSQGTVAVTAQAGEHALSSAVGITEEQGEIQLYLTPALYVQAADDVDAVPSIWTDQLVEVSGTALNMTSEDHFLEVDPSVPSVPYIAGTAVGPEWSVLVPPDEPFTLVAHEVMWGDDIDGARHYGIAVVEHSAVTEPTTATVDFSAPTPTTEVSGSFPLPQWEDSPFGTDSELYVFTRTTSSNETLMLGGRMTADFPGDGTCTYSAVYAELPWVSVDDTVTMYDLASGPWPHELLARVFADGYPRDGVQSFEFLRPPELTGPSNGLPLHEPIEWVLHDSDAWARLHIYRIDEQPKEPLVWVVTGPVGARGMTLPNLPASVSVEALLGAGPVPGDLWLYRSNPTTGRVDAQVGPVRLWIDVP